MSKQRPLGITILAVLVGIAAIIAVYHTLQFLHILPFSLGPIRFFAFDFFGALLWAIDAAILIWLTRSLWNLNPQGLLFVLVIAVLNLILAFLSILGQSSFAAMLPAILINGLILLYCLSPGVKEAFSQASAPAPAAAAPAMRTMQAPPVYQAPEPAVRAAAVPLETPVEVPTAPPPVAATPAVALDIPAEEPVASPIVEIPAEPVVRAAAVPLEIPAEEPAAPPIVEIPGVSPETSTEEPVALSRAEEISAETPASQPHHPRHKVDIETIEGIGPTYADKLKATGILTVADLLQAGASRKGREDLVEKTGVSSKLILKWVNMADLMRISGVGEEYSELLEAAGVDTVKELKNRNPDNLHQAMLTVNEQKKLVRRPPHLSEVRNWVEQAGLLEAVITY